jgi:lysophospholipase L1-like esterase
MKWTAILLTLALAGPLSAGPPKLQPVDGDRIVFLGGTLVERDQTFGYFEVNLLRQFAGVNFTFRNLGWSGDTVWGEARVGFGTQKEGYANLIKQVDECKPTILLVNYGMNESFEGEAGLAHFVEGYNALLDDLAKTGAKVWLISPNRHEDLGRPLPDPGMHNLQIKLYADAIGKIAQKRGCGFVNLFEILPDGTKENPPRAMTDNGIHFNDYGARRFGIAMMNGLGTPLSSSGPSAVAQTEASEQLRAVVVQKNREYFYRWRPQNETYIFGFRKHEQGRNAVEIPQFDPIVEKLEARINELKKTMK